MDEWVAGWVGCWVGVWINEWMHQLTNVKKSRLQFVLVLFSIHTSNFSLFYY